MAISGSKVFKISLKALTLLLVLCFFNHKHAQTVRETPVPITENHKFAEQLSENSSIPKALEIQRLLQARTAGAYELSRINGQHRAMIERLQDRSIPGPLSACFAPGSDLNLVNAFNSAVQARNAELDLFQASDNARWSATATNGSGLVRGQPTTITWSIIPDGTSIQGFIEEPTSNSDLIAFLDSIYPNALGTAQSELPNKPWFPLFEQVFQRWADLTGLSYVYVSDDGAAFGSSSGVLGSRGDVRIGGHFIDGNSNVLGYNFFPNGGDMVLDTADNFYTNTSNNSLRLRNVLSHEHGHGLGFPHVCPIEQTKLMEPFFSASFDGPQEDDRLGGNRLYGDRFESNNSAGTATNLGTLGLGLTTLTDLSIDGSGDIDFYRFTLSALRNVSIVLTPTGTTYLNGPQNVNGSCSAGISFNALTQNDVNLQLRAADGTTVLGSASGNPAGVAESLNEQILQAGDYFVRISGGSNNAAQMYKLDLNVQSPNVLTIADVSQPEGNGINNMTFTVQLAVPLQQTVTVDYATANGTAQAGSDYTATSGTLTFNPGETSKNFNVQILGDTVQEPNETFFVNLSNATNAVIMNAQAIGTLLNDDIVDLEVTQQVSAAGIIKGQNGSYTIVVRNNGTLPATNVVFTNTLPAGIELLSAQSSVGTVQNDNGTLTVALGGFAAGQSEQIILTFTVTGEGEIVNIASVTQTELDNVAGNNQSSVAFEALFAPTITSSTSAVGIALDPFQYVITATGSQPMSFAATPLPAGLILDGSIITGAPTESGTFAVTVTAQNVVDNDSIMLLLTIHPADDRDGDGIPNRFEQAVGTDPNDPDSRPEQVDDEIGRVYNVSQLRVSLNFKRNDRDGIAMKGTLGLDPDLLPADLDLVVFVGGVVQTFTLNEKGIGRSGFDMLRIKFPKLLLPGDPARVFTLKFAKGNFASILAEQGLVEEDIVEKGVRLRVLVMVEGLFQDTEKLLSYRARFGKSGSAR